MREFELRYPLKGLRPYQQERRNSEWLVECFNFRPTEQGIEHHRPFTKVTTSHDPSWPFPLILNGNFITLIIERNEIISSDLVYSLEDDLTLNHLTAIPWSVYGKSEIYELIDYGKWFVIWTDLFALNFNTQFNSITFIQSGEIPRFGCACNFNGQLVIGNIQSEWYDCNENYIAWSDVGNADFRVNATNSRGYMKLPVDGKVLRILKFKNNLIVYTTKGITSLHPLEDLPAFGVGFTHNFGIPNPNAVASGANEHVFVDSYGYVWTIGEKAEIKGYKEFISKLDLCKVKVTYDSFEDDFYISDGVKCYLYNRYGMTEVWQLVSSIKCNPVCEDSGCQPHNEFTRYATFLDSMFWCRNFILTGQIDFGLRGLKTIFTVEVGLDSPEDVKLAVDYRFRKSDEFERTNWVPLNHQSSAVLIAAGLDLRIAIAEGFEHPVDEDVNIDYLTIRYKMTDLRTIRGVYAPPLRGQGLEYD